jgi:hypothetical protein
MDGHWFDTTLFQKKKFDYRKELGESSVKYTKNTCFKILFKNETIFGYKYKNIHIYYNYIMKTLWTQKLMISWIWNLV